MLVIEVPEDDLSLLIWHGEADGPVFQDIGIAGITCLRAVGNAAHPVLDDVVVHVFDNQLVVILRGRFLAQDLGLVVIFDVGFVVNPFLNPLDGVALTLFLELLGFTETKRLDDGEVLCHVGIHCLLVHQFFEGVVHSQIRL